MIEMDRYEEALKRGEESRKRLAEAAREGLVISPIFHQAPIILPYEIRVPVGEVLLKRAQFYFDRIRDERELIKRQAVASGIGYENMQKFLIHMEEIQNIVDVFSLEDYSDQIDKLRGIAQGVVLSA